MGIKARALAAVAAGAAVSAASIGAAAHPHVWVATKSQAIFENGALTGLRYTWLFDEMYTTSAVEGLDKNNDGKLDAAELDELTKINIEGLKEFEYFTAVQMGGEPVTFGDAKDYSMEVITMDEPPGPQLVAGPDSAGAAQSPAATPAEPRRGLWSRFTGWVAGLFGRSPAQPTQQAAAAPQKPEPSKILALHMTLPLKSAVPAERLKSDSKGFRFTLADAQLYIWFEPTPKDGISVSAGAPAGCRAMFVEAELDEQQKKLQEAFGRVSGAAFSTPGRTAAVVCAAP